MNNTQLKKMIFFKLIIKIFIELRISTFLLNKNYLFEFSYMKAYAYIMNVDVFSFILKVISISLKLYLDISI